MQEIKHFGSVTVIVSGTRDSAVVWSCHPETLHEHEDEWNDAIRFLVAQGFEPPGDDPDHSSPDCGETYVVRLTAPLAAVGV